MTFNFELVLILWGHMTHISRVFLQADSKCACLPVRMRIERQSSGESLLSTEVARNQRRIRTRAPSFPIRPSHCRAAFTQVPACPPAPAAPGRPTDESFFFQEAALTMELPKRHATPPEG